MRCLVTGAGGFVGAALLEKVADPEGEWAERTGGWRFLGLTGGRVISAKRLSGRWFDRAIRSGRLEIAEYGMEEAPARLGDGFSLVLHLAAMTHDYHRAKYPAPFVHTNVACTAALLRWAVDTRVPRWIQTSTDEVYAHCDQEIKEGWKEAPRNLYAATKLCGDVMAATFASTSDMDVMVIRTQNAYGPKQDPAKAIPTFVRTALRGGPIPVYGDGGHVRRWIWVGDLADALLTAAFCPGPMPQGVMHVAGNETANTLQLARIVLDALGLSPENIEMVDPGDARPCHDRRSTLDASAFCTHYGWKPKKALSIGVAEAAVWNAQNQHWAGIVHQS